MANTNLNSALYFIEEYVVMYIGFNLQHIICMDMYISREGKIQRSITCTSRNVHVYMTHPMYRSGCHGVTPHPYVIAIYSTSTLKPDIR